MSSEFYISNSDNTEKLYFEYDPEDISPDPEEEAVIIDFQPSPSYDEDTLEVYLPLPSNMDFGSTPVGKEININLIAVSTGDRATLQAKKRAGKAQLFYDAWNNIIYEVYIKNISPQYISGSKETNINLILKIIGVR